MPYFKCLECGHRIFKQNVNEGELIQCTNYKCRSYWVIPEERYEAIINGLIEVVHNNSPISNIINSIVDILAANGITGRPLRTLRIAAKLVEEAERKKT